VDRRGPQYARNLPLGRIVELIRQGRGQTGTSREYLENTVRHLDELGIPDKRLHEVLRAVRGHA
jgi:cation transport protein ChaC